MLVNNQVVIDIRSILAAMAVSAFFNSIQKSQENQPPAPLGLF